MAIQLLYPKKVSRNSSKTTAFIDVAAQFGDSYYQAAPRGLNPVRDTWDISWITLTLAEKDALEISLNSVGVWGTLLWTPCYETVEKRFRVGESGYTTLRVAGNSVFSVKCKLIQRFDL